MTLEFTKSEQGVCQLQSEQNEQLLIRSGSVVSRVVGGETLIVPVRGKVGDLASIYSFNGTGTLIWRLLEEPRGLAELSSAVEREYEVAPKQAREGVMRFVEDLLSVGLVEVCRSAAIVAAEASQAGWETARMSS
jgi:hypothetical protein